jgi:hypothetical protein
MIRLIAVAFALAVATSAEAMSPTPLHEPDSMITQIRKARNCWDPNQVRVNGLCEFDARPVPPSKHKCISWSEGVCVEYYGTLKGWRARR